MADNSVTNLGSGGSTFVGALLTFSGDSAVVSGMFPMIITGSEGSWTGNQIVGGAGDVAAGVQRVTLANDDPAVTTLQLIDNAISGAGFNITQFGGAAVPIGAGTEERRSA